MFARVVVGVLGAFLVALMLAEFFVAFLLPRRVKRDPRIARGVYAVLWRPWRALARRLSPAAGDTLLGFFGPASLLGVLALWSLGLILGFAALQWAFGSRVVAFGTGSLLDDLVFSTGGFLSESSGYAPSSIAAQVLLALEAATGFAVLFVVIGYLPALFQAFSRREIAVSRLDPRAGSPPSAARLLEYFAEHGGWPALARFLQDWEAWAAELMETHLAYPVLAYFRSQHVGQSWLAAFTTVLDAAAFSLAAGPPEVRDAAGPTFALGRHALADIAHGFRAPRPTPPPKADRLDDASFHRLCALLREGDFAMPPEGAFRQELDELRTAYEPSAAFLSRVLELPLPSWVSPEKEATGQTEGYRPRFSRRRRRSSRGETLP